MCTGEGVNGKIGFPAPSFFRVRPLFTSVCCFALGICSAKAACLDGLRRAIPTILVAVIALVWLVHGNRRFALLCICFFVGAGACALRLIPPPMPKEKAWRIEGTICSEPGVNEEACWCVLRDVTVWTQDGQVQTLPGRLSCYFAADGASGLRYGERVQAQGSSYAPRGQRNPGGENEILSLALDGAYMRFYAYDPVIVVKRAGFSLRGLSIDAANALAARMDVLFGAASPLLRAVLLGDTGAMPHAWTQWMNRSGIAHILAVSGLHVALWFSLLRSVVAFLHPCPWQRLVMLAVLLAAYTLLTGMRDSAIRAAVMLLTLESGRAFKRRSDPLTSLALAAFIILLVRPLDLFAPGFTMSFGAVLGLLFFKRVARRWTNRGVLSHLKRSLMTTAAAQLGALVPMVGSFGMVSAVSLLTNLVALPLVGLLLPFGAVAVALDYLYAPLGAVPASIARGFAAMLMGLSSAASRLPFATIRIPTFAPWTAVAYYAGLFLLSSAVVWSWHTRIAALAVLTLCAVLCGMCLAEPAVFYEQLDVGESLCGVLHAWGKRYVFDCGERGGGLSTYLRRYAGGVEALFISHPHADHFSGLADLLEDDVPIGTIYVPVEAGVFGKDAEYDELLNLAKNAGTQIVALCAGDTLRFDGVTIDVFAPPASTSAGTEPNDRSLALRIVTEGWTLTRDLVWDGATEPEGVACDILQVAHHGSADASNKRALEGMNPRIALISCGESRYHPNEQTVNRLVEAGASVYITREEGAIRVVFFPDRLEVTGFCR